MLQLKQTANFYNEKPRAHSSLSSIPDADVHERPLHYADRVGSWYVAQVSADHRKNHGLYLTPPSVAEFMAGLYDTSKSSISLLDPAAGAGILICALVEHIVTAGAGRLTQITVTAYEIDAGLVPCLHATLGYLKKWCAGEGVALNITVLNEDFILSQSHNLMGSDWLFNGEAIEHFDIVIANPPYFKIGKNDPRALAAASVVHGQPNIYALFMAVGAAILAENGILIFITPRSFASGQYFKAFRQKFFALIKPELVHVFESRRDAFSRDEVLQENIIIKGVRKNSTHDGEVIISSSQGARDIKHSIARSVDLDSILDRAKGNILKLPVSIEDSMLVELVDSWEGSLKKYGLNISTGQVVPFRATDLLEMQGNVPTTHTPLLWMNHTSAMLTEWPKNTRKPEYIKNSALQRGLLIPNKNYVLLRRFSSKEEKRRLTAAPYLAKKYDTPLIAFENHLNYIHRPSGELTKDEALGLAALLNSTIMNRYYRIMNGNTQVGATELRVIPLPPYETIIAIGKAIKGVSDIESAIDDVVNGLLFLPQSNPITEEAYA